MDNKLLIFWQLSNHEYIKNRMNHCYIVAKLKAKHIFFNIIFKQNQSDLKNFKLILILAM